MSRVVGIEGKSLFLGLDDSFPLTERLGRNRVEVRSGSEYFLREFRDELRGGISKTLWATRVSWVGSE
jgi:hypothetical protein